jgi:membrane associated rhomboid family serine protease
MRVFPDNPCDPRRNLTPVVGWLLGLTVASYFAQVLVDRVTANGASHLLGLSAIGFMHGWIWQFVTYQFLHGGVFHLLFNMVCLYMMGPELERAVGSRRFLVIYLVSGAVGGAGWLAIQYPEMGYCIGASGAVFGVMAAFATLFPRLPLTVYLFPLFLPITLQARVLVGIMALIQLALLLEPSSGHIAYAAHLAGALGGFGLVWMHRRGADAGTWWARRRAAAAQQREQAQQADVDRILDKLAREGLHKLTEPERRLLDTASRRMRR